VPDEWRGRSEDKKQGSDGVVSTSQSIMASSSKANMWSLRYYQTLLNQGVAPEQARMVLPQSMMTEWYWSGSLDAFADMCKLRCADDTQAETREVAELIAGQMYELFPVSWESLAEGNYEG
jgi:thymidylate synthase (FAD)